MVWARFSSLAAKRRRFGANNGQTHTQEGESSECLYRVGVGGGLQEPLEKDGHGPRGAEQQRVCLSRKHLAATASPFQRPEDELEHLTKKMLYDMENPPSDEYFGRCSRCGENVVGEGTGCTAMDQVFHVECFTCMTCGSKLRGQPFYAVEKKAYCEPCYIVSTLRFGERLLNVERRLV
ncbi:hypothetical protein lerEdw1_001171 [Lerista edwardsae]|nr:hypothetical protein lerEdw1_001172 [Lerista edwardsae]KAJ6651031.1 hypothetical protein lerEdw1_001171 [Lerista edwardsae]